MANVIVSPGLVVRDGMYLHSGRMLMVEGVAQCEAEVINVIAQRAGPLGIGSDTGHAGGTMFGHRPARTTFSEPNYPQSEQGYEPNDNYRQATEPTALRIDGFDGYVNDLRLRCRAEEKERDGGEPDDQK